MIIKSNNESSTKKTVGSDNGPPVAAKPPVSHIPGSQSNHLSHDEESGPYTPQYTRQSSQDSDAQASHKMSRQTSAKDRVRDRGRKFDKGYRVLAEVTPNLGISSRGSKLFMKQRHRMQNFVTEADTNEDPRTQLLGNTSDASEGASDTWATPWNMASKSSSSIQYIPAKKLAGEPTEMLRDRQKDPLGFLPKPPDFWRAKVEQNYPHNGPTPSYRLRSRSVGRHRKVSSDPSVYANFVKRPDSAPMAEEPPDYSQPYNGVYARDAANDENRENYIYVGPPRPASATLPTFHFNAKRYYNAAERHQGLSNRNTFKATPYVYRDFNAVPKGWHRKY